MARLLFDLTRSFSRLNRATPTGIDRVEAALFAALLRLAHVDAIVRSGGRIWMGPGPDVAQAMGDNGPADARSMLRPWRNGKRRAAESDLRRAFGAGLGVLPPKPDGRWLFCAGHSLPDAHLIDKWRTAGGRMAVLVHDLIPLGHPDWSRPKPAQRFAMTMQTVAHAADLILHLTQAGQRRWEERFATFAGQRHVILPMGATQLPHVVRTPRERPEFLMLGTIEPRKGHATILDIWDGFAPAADLSIIGRRGWRNEAVFARLDAGVPGVREVPDANDQDVADALARAHTLLFPSLAEGYGLPVMEARARGVPVLASDLPELRELHGDAIGYVPAGDNTAWELAINGALRADKQNHAQPAAPWQSWDAVAKILIGHMIAP